MKAVCLLSLTTDFYSKSGINKINKWHIKNKDSKIIFILLDSLEEINKEYFQVSEERQDALACIIKNHTWPSDVVIRRSASYEKDDNFQKHVNFFNELFLTTREFRGLCLSQVYRSLHPKLKLLGIKNQRHEAVTCLARYLTKEFALLAHLHEKFKIELELSHHKPGLARSWLDKKACVEYDMVKLPTSLVI